MSTTEPMPQTPPAPAVASDEPMERNGSLDQAVVAYEADELMAFNLQPPPPAQVVENPETLGSRFFSVDHLDVILRDFALSARFAAFVARYQTHHVEALAQYTEMRKVVAAIHYANAVAERLSPTTDDSHRVAMLERGFEERQKQIGRGLVREALPGFLTQCLVSLVTESLVKEITGYIAPVMQAMVPALAEVYCLTDPSLPDNPIVYASDEFFNVTQYGRDYVIGRNCRFLSGPKTSRRAVERMRQAMKNGQEVCETLVNYRRDGSPFMNLLMIAPLYDNKGVIRYFIGCQIDVSPLVEGGRGIQSFSQLLAQDRAQSRFGKRFRSPKQTLGELTDMFSEEDTDVVRGHMTRASISQTVTSVDSERLRRPHSRARILVGVGKEPANDHSLWPTSSLGPSGRLPGVYQNYLLVRPYPSLRITFTSPALRIPGMLQTKFIDRIVGPDPSVADTVLDAFIHGVAITAKVDWLAGSSINSPAKSRYIHCTPLIGSDEQVGVWMVVMVENEQITGQLNRNHARTPTILSSTSSTREAMSSLKVDMGLSRPNFSSRLYADYLREEARPDGEKTPRTDSPQGRRREGSGDGDPFANF